MVVVEMIDFNFLTLTENLQREHTLESILDWLQHLWGFFMQMLLT